MKLGKQWPRTEDGTFESPNKPSIYSPTPRAAYPTRYYARIFKDEDRLPQDAPGLVYGWVDAWAISSVENLPPASEMVPMTIEQWAYRECVDDHGILIHFPAVYRDGAFYDLY